MSRVPFEKLDSTIKGTIGEVIVYEYIKSKGLIPYQPVFDGAHPFDMMVARYGKKNLLVMAEIKTKKRKRNKAVIGGVSTYVTGFDTRSLNIYLEFMKKYKIPVHVYFVDELEKIVYGGKLEELTKNTMQEYNITLFRLCDMHFVQTITDLQAAEIEKHTKSKYIYPAVGIEKLCLKTI